MATELERFGLRNASGPFDWLISDDLSKIFGLMKNSFEDFLNEEFLYQIKSSPSRYKNTKYEVYFFHDFTNDIFAKQIEAVSQKYKRRIDRFLSDIGEPTLFLRYIVSSNEYNYILNHFSEVLEVVKSFNAENNIIFICNEEIALDKSKEYIYTVEKDENDVVARNFLDKNEELRNYLLSDIFDSSLRAKNLERYENKGQKEDVGHPVAVPYVHDKVIDI